MRGGYNENKTEVICWKKTKASFLAPVYFGCGLINIQKHERGDVPSAIEIRKIRKRWAEITEGELYKINEHCFSKNNFRIRDGLLRLIDYGDKGFEKEHKQIPFTEIIIKWHKELQNKLDKKEDMKMVEPREGEEKFAVRPLGESDPEQYCTCGQRATHVAITSDDKEHPVCTKQICINPFIFPKHQ